MSYVLLDERRVRFISATVKVIREKGIANATTRRIAEEARVPLASLHYTFKSKEELFVATMKELAEAGQREIEAKIFKGIGVSNAVATIIKSYIEWIKTSRVDQLVEYELHLWAHRHPEFSDLPSESYRTWLDFVRRLLILANGDQHENCAIDIENLTRTVLALIDGLNLQLQLYGDLSIDASLMTVTRALRKSVENGDFDKK